MIRAMSRAPPGTFLSRALGRNARRDLATCQALIVADYDCTQQSLLLGAWGFGIIIHCSPSWVTIPGVTVPTELSKYLPLGPSPWWSAFFFGFTGFCIGTRMHPDQWDISNLLHGSSFSSESCDLSRHVLPRAIVHMARINRGATPRRAP